MNGGEEEGMKAKQSTVGLNKPKHKDYNDDGNNKVLSEVDESEVDNDYINNEDDYDDATDVNKNNSIDDDDDINDDDVNLYDVDDNEEGAAEYEEDEDEEEHSSSDDKVVKEQLDDDNDNDKLDMSKEVTTSAEGKSTTEQIKKQKKVHKLSLDKVTNFNEILQNRGVIYIARIPPRMTPSKVKTILSDYGEVTRVYLQEEDVTVRKRRKKNGGSYSKRYTEGWVEMSSKRVAKQIVQTLHLSPISTIKRNTHYGDLWNLKYLSKFKWSHLTEKVAYERRVREQKIRLETLQARRETINFKQLVETGKRLDHIEERRNKKKRKVNDDTTNSTSTTTTNTNKQSKKSSYNTIRQVQPLDERLDKSSKSALLGALVKK